MGSSAARSSPARAIVEIGRAADAAVRYGGGESGYVIAMIPPWLAVLVSIALSIAPALAAPVEAGCGDTGERTVALDAGKRQEIAGLRVADQAVLALADGDAGKFTGIVTPTGDVGIAVTLRGDVLAFAVRDRSGQTGTLAMALPKQLTVVTGARIADPGHETEWRLTAAAAGSGIFHAGLGPRQFLTLILRHGDCRTEGDFTRWRLEMRGPKVSYTLSGGLAPPH